MTCVLGSACKRVSGVASPAAADGGSHSFWLVVIACNDACAAGLMHQARRADAISGVASAAAADGGCDSSWLVGTACDDACAAMLIQPVG